MNNEVFREDVVYSVGDWKLDEENYKVIQKTIQNSNVVGFVVGHYDEKLSISHVSSIFLQNLGYDFEEFMMATSGSLRNLFYGENVTFLKPERFPKIQGTGEGCMLTKENVPIYVRMIKQDGTDSEGNPIWVLSAQVDWMQQNLKLVNNVIQSGMWYFDCDENGQIIEVNWSHEFRRMIGYHDISDFPNELKSWTDLIHPEDKERVIGQLEAAIRDKTNHIKYDVEYRLKVTDGTYQWFRSSAETSRRLDGTVRRMVGIFVCVEGKKEAEMQIKRSAAFHRAYTESNICEYYVNLKRNTFSSMKVQESVMGVLAKSRTWDDLVQNYLDNFVLEEDKEALEHFYDRGYLLEKLKEGKSEISLECRIHLDGEERWVRNVVMHGEVGVTSHYAIIFVRDITEAKREAEDIKALHKKNKAQDQLLQGVVRLVNRFAMCDFQENYYEFYSFQDEASYQYQPRGKYSDFSDHLCESYKAVGETESLKELFSADNLCQKISNSEDIYQFEYCTLDEAEYKVASFMPIEWEEGKLMKALFVSMDITKAKKMEEDSRKALKEAYEAAERANKAKTEFLSNMSHDIRTPMNAIVGMTAIAGAHIDNKERVLDCLGKITVSSRHLLGLINEILDMSRIESGKATLTEEEFNLPNLVDNLVTMTREDMKAHHHEFEVHLGKIEHENVCGDSLRIQQVVTNIMSNAIKYTPNGGKIVFSISEKPGRSKNVGCYEITIEDNGIGMSKEFQEVMFDPFTRVDDKRSSKIQGTGLGMAITRNIVSMMNGHIEVESELGKGTRFTVTIFLRFQQKDKVDIEELAELPVLVVDDDKISCESTVETLKSIGMVGEWVTSGEEAIRMTAKRHEEGRDYFAILVDWQMPGMDGVETTRQLRERVGENIPIIVLTAYDYSEIEKEARAVGVNEFITKPLFESRLTVALKGIVDGERRYSARDYLTNISRCNYQGKRVLLVEDNELNSEIAEEILSMAGLEVETAEDGKVAVEKVSNHPEGYYDLVFMDIQMPVMNGYEATAAIRSLDSKARAQVPIVAMTANAFVEDVELAKNAGMNEHIAKPMDMNRLYEVLKRWIPR